MDTGSLEVVVFVIDWELALTVVEREVVLLEVVVVVTGEVLVAVVVAEVKLALLELEIVVVLKLVLITVDRDLVVVIARVAAEVEFGLHEVAHAVDWELGLTVVDRGTGVVGIVVPKVVVTLIIGIGNVVARVLAWELGLAVVIKDVVDEETVSFFDIVADTPTAGSMMIVGSNAEWCVIRGSSLDAPVGFPVDAIVSIANLRVTRECPSAIGPVSGNRRG